MESGNSRKRKMIYGCCSALLVLLMLLAVVLSGKAKTEKDSFEVVALGDSVFGQVRDDTAVPTHVGRMIGRSLFNGAFGGTCVAKIDRDVKLDYGNDSLSLVELTKAIEVGDFGPQQAAWMRGSNTEYFEATIDELEHIDFAKADMVLICQGLNDYYAGVPLHEEDGFYREYTFEGALRESIRTLRRIKPDIRIVLVTPTYNWHLWNKETCEELNTGFGILEDYVNAEIRMAEEMEIEVIDLYHDFFPHQVWEDWEIYTIDGMHPNEAGRELMTEKIADYLR